MKAFWQSVLSLAIGGGLSFAGAWASGATTKQAASAAVLAAITALGALHTPSPTQQSAAAPEVK